MARAPWIAGLLLSVGLTALWVEAQNQAPFKVVAHASVPVSSLAISQLSKMFLKQVSRWEDQTPVLPVDQVETSPVRQNFTREIHGRSVTAIKSYWQRMIFSGREVPPPEKPSDAQVLDYVRSNPGAIGYIAQDTPLVSGVKVIQVSE